jgi:D-lactate dehydrogenase
MFARGPVTPGTAKRFGGAEIAGIFVNTRMDSGLLGKFPKLKFIATMSTGFDHIDLEVCKKRGIGVSNVPSYGERTVAEYTIGLMLALLRKICRADARAKSENFLLEGLTGSDLSCKTLGLIGFGRIGRQVSKMARAFEMNVIVYDINRDAQLSRELMFKYVSLEKLLRSSDIISIHAPLNESTYHLINIENVKLIRKGAFLVNTARGAIVDTRALLLALDRRIIAGAALDVLEGEEDIRDERELLQRDLSGSRNWSTFLENHLLLKEKNVIVTPHNAFNSIEALNRIIKTTVRNIDAFLKGKKLNRVA